ncbi:MAG: hypothetical protein HKN03_13115 [Acidimicrobiales bacterium]|nr:hypothetical protein [Acidimicrobiales bacterium]
MKPVQSVRVRYDLVGAGWANAHLILDGTVTIITASNNTDALGSLLTAAGSLAQGQKDARCTWEGERNETRWVFNWRADGLRLRVLEFGMNERFWDDKDGKVLADVIVDRPQFIRAVGRAAEDVLYHHGVDGYRAMWRSHPFPLTRLAELRVAFQNPRAA